MHPSSDANARLRVRRASFIHVWHDFCEYSQNDRELHTQSAAAKTLNHASYKLNRRARVYSQNERVGNPALPFIVGMTNLTTLNLAGTSTTSQGARFLTQVCCSVLRCVLQCVAVCVVGCYRLLQLRVL